MRRKKYKKYKLRRIIQKRIAKERIKILSDLIKNETNPKYIKRYKELILKIKKKYKV